MLEFSKIAIPDAVTAPQRGLRNWEMSSQLNTPCTAIGEICTLHFTVVKYWGLAGNSKSKRSEIYPLCGDMWVIIMITSQPIVCSTADQLMVRIILENETENWVMRLVSINCLDLRSEECWRMMILRSPDPSITTTSCSTVISMEITCRNGAERMVYPQVQAGPHITHWLSLSLVPPQIWTTDLSPIRSCDWLDPVPEMSLIQIKWLEAGGLGWPVQRWSMWWLMFNDLQLTVVVMVIIVLTVRDDREPCHWKLSTTVRSAQFK